MKISNDQTSNKVYEYPQEKIDSDKELINEKSNDILTSKIIKEKLDNDINLPNTSTIPELSAPKYTEMTWGKFFKQITEDLASGKLTKDNGVKGESSALTTDEIMKTIKKDFFNFLSDEMMKIIQFIIKYLTSMINKYISTRELNNTMMEIQLKLADKQNEDCKQKATTMIVSAAVGSALSIGIGATGAVTSGKGLTKKIVNETNKTNNTILAGQAITAAAEPIGRVAEQSIQSQNTVVEGEMKVLDARAGATSQVISNNNNIQHEMMEMVTTLIKALESIIRANQETASNTASNLRG